MDKQEIERKIQEEFYWFHQHPELSYEEVETTKRLRQDLQQTHIRILDLPLRTGLVAEIGTGKAPFVALRCDIDALPIEEASELSYKSQVPGKMHACGHDFHAATILGSAYILKNMEADIKGTVRIIFQPAEEAPGGALKILESGGLKEVQAIFGIHSTPLFPAGEIAVQEGAVTAAVDRFAVTFTGKGAHAAHPDSGIDPIVAAASFVSSVQSIVSRNVDPFAANLVSITHFASGSTWNVIPETAFLEGTVRTMTAKDRQDVRNRLYALADHIARAYGATAAVEWFSGPPATANDSAWTAIAQAEARQQGMVVRRLPPSLGGEDFAFYQEHIRGVFIHMGTGLSYSAHNPRFQVDPKVLLPAAAYMSGLALRGLKELNITSGSGKND